MKMHSRSYGTPADDSWKGLILLILFAVCPPLATVFFYLSYSVIKKRYTYTSSEYAETILHGNAEKHVRVSLPQI